MPALRRAAGLGPASLAALLASAPLSAAPVDFVVTPQMGREGLERLAVTLSFAGDGDGRTSLELPDDPHGLLELYQAIEDLRVEGGVLVDQSDPTTRLIRHSPGARLTVSYSVPLSGRDPDLLYAMPQPVLRPGWFYVYGQGALVVPSGRRDEPARLRWGPTPPGWTLASSLEAMTEADLTVGRLAPSILVGGADLRVLRRDVGGQKLRLAIRGAWSFGDDAFADALARLMTAENLYLTARPLPQFVSLMPLVGGEAGVLDSEGMGWAGGFALIATENIDFPSLLDLSAHEYGHRWFGSGFGPMPHVRAREFWFSEGLNSFVASQALVSAGLWSERDYAEALNRLLLRYAESPFRTRPYWTLTYWGHSGGVTQMLYDRGHLFALALMRDFGRGRLRETLVRMAANADGYPADRTQAARFVGAFPVDWLQEEVLTFIQRGQPIELPTDLFAPCGRIRWLERPAYDFGYDLEQRPDGLFIASVDEGSRAWSAGLRPGMRHVRLESITEGDSRAPIVMRIADAEGERVLSWLPQGARTVRFQRLELREFRNAAQAARCRDRLAGY